MAAKILTHARFQAARRDVLPYLVAAPELERQAWIAFMQSLKWGAFGLGYVLIVGLAVYVVMGGG